MSTCNMVSARRHLHLHERHPKGCSSIFREWSCACVPPHHSGGPVPHPTPSHPTPPRDGLANRQQPDTLVTAEAEWDHRALLSFTDPHQDCLRRTIAFRVSDSLGKSEGAQDHTRKGFSYPCQKLLQTDERLGVGVGKGRSRAASGLPSLYKSFWSGEGLHSKGFSFLPSSFA